MKELFNEASRISDACIETRDEIAYFYSGFKILKYKETEEITLWNTRISDFYSEVHGDELNRFLENGFEKTCDELQMDRDRRRINIADHYIMKAILNEDETKHQKLKKERLALVLKINKLTEKEYEQPINN